MGSFLTALCSELKGRGRGILISASAVSNLGIGSRERIFSLTVFCLFCFLFYADFAKSLAQPHNTDRNKRA